MKKNLIAAAALFALVGCSKQNAAESPAQETPAAEAETAPAETAPAASAATMVIKPFKLTLTNSTSSQTMELIVDDAGQVRAVMNGKEEKEIGTLTGAGEFRSMDGKALLSIDGSGKIQAAGSSKTMTIAADGNLVVDGETKLSYADDGTITFTGLKDTGKYDGPADARRAATLLIAASTMASAPSDG